MLLAIVFLPFFGSLFSGLFGFFIGRKGSVFITTLTTFLSFLFSFIIFVESIKNEYEYILHVSNWIDSGLFHCNWNFLFDTLTMSLLVVVTSISTLVHLYSSEYMISDPHLSRFMSYLSLFTFFMIILVTGDNFIQMFVGWEGVGFCSFLLINFWFTRLQANKAAIKAMLVNRISDLILLLGIITLFFNLRSVEYFSLFAAIPLLENFSTFFLDRHINVIDLASILIFIGAMGKSAQIFLHTWLPDAMEGPTPVSALIHAATMVTAGVYLTSRCSPIFESSIFVLKWITIIGASTAFFASTVALLQNDFKKIIAYSTCSQLGYMFFSCGLSNYPAAIFHLSNHAYFKALLFLCSGAVIHAMGDEQDIRKMGGLRKILPFTYIMFLIGSLSLAGFPFLTGFYSKDFILETAFANFHETGHYAYWLGTFGAFLTAFYSTRLLFLVFLTETNSYKNIISHAHDVSLKMGLPLGILAFGSIFVGYLSRDMFIGLGSNFWNNSLFVHPSHNLSIDAEFLPTFIKIVPVLFSILGISLGFLLYTYQRSLLFKWKLSKKGLHFYHFFNRKWYFDKIYHEWINQYILNIGFPYTYKQIDKGLIEWFGPYGLTFILKEASLSIIQLQTGYIFHYSLLIFLNSLCIILLTFIVIFSSFHFVWFFLFLFFLLSLKKKEKV